MKNLFIIALLTLSIVLSPIAVKAEQIQFEEGGASQSVGIVPTGALQVETVFMNYTNLNKNQGSSFELMETLFRYGIYNDRIEARARIGGLTLVDGSAGMDNIGLGTKIGLTKADGLIPTADLIIDFQIPVNNDINSDNFTHSYKITTDSPINSKCSISSNLSLVFASTDRSSGADFTRTVVPYVIGFNAKLTDKLSLNNDFFGTWSMSGNQGNQLGLATYATYYFQDNLAGVASTVLGFNDNTDPFSFYTGIVYRF